ncbi:MAG: SGNH/GDSL hydrolase family protein [Clostridia bacterium]|nr:SGNH/GDSL hydrolase family protein [Clostridia bacterium]
MADISKIKIGDEEYSIKDEKRHGHENKDVLDLITKGEHGNLTLDGAIHWSVANGGVIENIETDETTGDITLLVRYVPNPAIPAEEIKIKQSLDIPEVNNITPEQTTFFEFAPSSNLLDFSTKQVGLLNNDGKIYTGGSYDNYRYFEQYIPVDVGDEISLQYTYNGTRYNYSVTNNAAIFSRVAAYDSNKQILKTLGAITNSTNKVTVYTVPETVAYIRISLSNNCDSWTDIAVVKNTSVVLPYEEYGTNSKVQLKSEYIPEKKNKVLAFMPDEIICATGRTIEIYNNQICPLAEKYYFRWVCDIGKALKRKFSITGTEDLIGDYDLILEIYDDTETCLYSKTSKLKIVTGTIADNVSICPIGDSLTNGKHWLNEVRTLSENKVSYVGTRGNTEGVKHEGRSGFTSKGYLTAQTYDFENEGVHPFWDGSKFSWSHYKTNSGINPSAVQIFLGTNDLFGNTTAETFSGNIKTMVDDIRSTDANIPIFVVMTILTGNQNGLGKQQSTDGFASYKGKYKYALDCKFIKAMNLLYDTLKDYSNLYFVPLTECHDNEYNFGAVETPVNPRATQTEYMPNEGIHPQQQGYEQMADVMYSVYCRAFISQ